MRNEEEKRKKKSGGLGEEYKKSESENGKRRGEQECRKESFAPFSSACFQYSLLKKNFFDAKQKCAEKTRRERSELLR